MNNYSKLKELAKTRKRKLANNTYLTVREDGGFGIKLHNTEVVIHYPDRVVLDSGGWLTVTTKSRMNEFTDLRIYQDNYDWFVDGIVSNTSIPFTDGMTIQLGGSR
jgi:hypothetical protein|tara:strand:- start:599 stop:916 length:318 start_codon:yes stop_codon:yes gene_type:complete